MSEQRPVIDVFIGRDGDAWRLYFAPQSWRPGMLHAMLDQRRSVFPVGRPDGADLDRFMWETDSPYDKRPTADGGLEIQARGRSAVTFAVWLADLIAAGQPAVAPGQPG